LPERVSLALTASSRLCGVQEEEDLHLRPFLLGQGGRAIFTFVHFFLGKEDVLGAAISRLASINGMAVKCYSLDLESDLLQEQPYGDILYSCRNGEVDAGHAWLLFNGSISPWRNTTGEELGMDLWVAIQLPSTTSQQAVLKQIGDPCWPSDKSGHIGEPAG